MSRHLCSTLEQPSHVLTMAMEDQKTSHLKQLVSCAHTVKPDTSTCYKTVHCMTSDSKHDIVDQLIIKKILTNFTTVDGGPRQPHLMTTSSAGTVVPSDDSEIMYHGGEFYTLHAVVCMNLYHAS